MNSYLGGDLETYINDVTAGVVEHSRSQTLDGLINPPDVPEAGAIESTFVQDWRSEQPESPDILVLAYLPRDRREAIEHSLKQLKITAMVIHPNTKNLPSAKVVLTNSTSISNPAIECYKSRGHTIVGVSVLDPETIKTAYELHQLTTEALR